MFRGKFFYGWAICSMGVLGNALQGGFVFWSAGIYNAVYEDAFGATRAQVNLSETMVSIAVNVISPFLGYLVDKWSARKVAALGPIFLGLGFIVISVAGTLMSVYAASLTLLPIGILALGVMPSGTLIARWFRKRRGLALGISTTGSSLGGSIATIIVASLFASLGWRDAMLVIGIGLIATAPILYVVLADFPEDRGLEQEAESDNPADSLSEADRANWTYLQILREPQFYIQTLISGTLLAVTLGLLANLGLHAKDLGLTLAQSASVYSIIALFSFGGKIVFGALFDRLGMRVTGFLVAGLMASGVAALLFAQTATELMLSGFLIGSGFGGVTPLWTNLIARGFGAQSYGRTIGIMNPFHIPITATAPVLAGHISDTTGSYTLVFLLYLAFCAVAAIALTQLRPPIHADRRAQPA